MISVIVCILCVNVILLLLFCIMQYRYVNNKISLLSQTEMRMNQIHHAFDNTKYDLEKVVHPLCNTLSFMEDNINKINETRKEEYYKLSEQIKFLLESNRNLQLETGKLSQMLKNPQMRGKWGEMQLRNIVERTGMSNYTSFCEQVTLKDDDNSIFRPDLIINIPGERKIIIDSKMPLSAYLEAYESIDDAIYKEKILEHVKALKMHIKQLGQKKYWSKIDTSPAFVILFLPAESFLSIAMQYDKDILDYADSYNVVVMTPILLLSMLRIIAHGWQQEKLYQNNAEISKISGEMYKKLHETFEIFNKMGNGLESMIIQYNKVSTLIESKVMNLANKLHSLGISKEEKKIESLKEVDIKIKKS